MTAHFTGRWRLALACALQALVLLGITSGAHATRTPTLELTVHADGRPLALNQFGVLADAGARPLAITRLDLLLSQLRLRRTDGTWFSAPEWHAFFRADQPARRQPLPPVPAGEYVELQFTVGVAPKANHGDPNRLRPDDPLHPVVNGLHWGWAGGYVFMALEGHWQPDHGRAENAGGFSYHLANDGNTVRVRLPQRVSLREGTALRLRLDAKALLSRIDVSRHGDSTHSRAQDPLVVALKGSLAQAFTLSAQSTSSDAPSQGRAAPAPASAAPALSAPALPVPASSAPASPRASQPLTPFALAVDASLPSVALPADNPLTVEGVALGELLFNDRRLSLDNSVSCASCHRRANAFSDGGRTLSAGVGGRLGERNAMPIFNLAWVGEFFWDGRTSRLSRQALEPIQHPHEMAETLPRVLGKLTADRALGARFVRVFGGPPTAERLGLALEQYMLSLVSKDSKFDRAVRGSDRLTAQERRGQELFLTEHDPANGLYGADCFHCHSGALFTNHRFANNGLPLRAGDVGRERVTRDPADRGKFRTPSLRNIAITGPYMHDGRFRTLEEVIDHYDSGIERSATLDPNIAKHPRQGLRLSRDDKAALVAFLRTLTDPAFAPPDQLATGRPARADASGR